MGNTLSQIMSNLKDHQQLQSLKLERGMGGQRRLLSFLSAPGRTEYMRTIFNPYIRKQLRRQKIQTVTWAAGKAVIWIYLILLAIGIIVKLTS